ELRQLDVEAEAAGDPQEPGPVDRQRAEDGEDASGDRLHVRPTIPPPPSARPGAARGPPEGRDGGPRGAKRERREGAERGAEGRGGPGGGRRSEERGPRSRPVARDDRPHRLAEVGLGT